MADDKLSRIFNFNETSVLNNIYCGYVKDVVKNINAAFVEFGEDKKGYLSLKGIDAKIKQGDKILVQVSGDKIKTKEYTLTADFNLNSECLVLTEGKTGINISKKITEEDIRNRLKNSIKQFVNEEYGFILRTNSVDFTSEEIQKQAEKLIERRKNIKKSFQYAAPKSVIEKRDYFEYVCKEYIDKFNCDIITDNREVFDTLNECGIDSVYDAGDKISLSNKFALEKHLRQALSKKVWLKSGAYLVIEPTEALTVIDVNTGKAEFRTNKTETIKRINKEAALEIARQIQIRNLSGIVIIDFINMDSQEDYDLLEQYMREAVSRDFIKCYVVGFTKLGLMEVSRKKQEKPLYEFIEITD